MTSRPPHEPAQPSRLQICPISPSEPPPRARLLAIATNPEVGASTRFRILQWRPYLEQAGFSLWLDAFFSGAGAEVLYRRGQYVAKLGFCAAGAVRRLTGLARASRRADVLFIHRETFPLGWAVGVRLLKRFAGAILYDYDDAMFLPQRQGRGALGRFEALETPKRLMAMSHTVLAGNSFLAEYARPYARRVVVLPTCIDTSRFRPPERPSARDGCLRVGWIGSHSTTKYLQSLRTVLEAVGQRVPFRLDVVGSSSSLSVPGIAVERSRWCLEREVDDFARCDIGIYPLWDDPWSLGKCGFKAIQFMACGVPVVAAAVGVNRQIIEDGVNGFLASTPEEWIAKLSTLLTEPGLREQFSRAGRRTIEERYSLTAHAATLLRVLQAAHSDSAAPPLGAPERQLVCP